MYVDRLGLVAFGLPAVLLSPQQALAYHVEYIAWQRLANELEAEAASVAYPSVRPSVYRVTARLVVHGSSLAAASN